MAYISENSPLMNWVQKKDHINVFFINMVVKVEGIINNKSKYNWRCLKLDQLKQIQILDEPLQKPEIVSHKKPSYCVDIIIKQIYIE